MNPRRGKGRHFANSSLFCLKGHLMYGSYAPAAPDLSIDDVRFRELWLNPQRYCLAAPDELLPHLKELVGEEELVVVARSGGKFPLTNHILSPKGLMRRFQIVRMSFADNDGRLNAGGTFQCLKRLSSCPRRPVDETA